MHDTLSWLDSNTVMADCVIFCTFSTFVPSLREQYSYSCIKISSLTHVPVVVVRMKLHQAKTCQSCGMYTLNCLRTKSNKLALKVILIHLYDGVLQVLFSRPSCSARLQKILSREVGLCVNISKGWLMEIFKLCFQESWEEKTPHQQNSVV